VEQAERIGLYVPRYVGAGRTLTVVQFIADRARYPQLWKALLFSCAKTQFLLVKQIWKDQFDVSDPQVEAAFRGLVLSGYFPKIVDVESALAQDLIRAAVAGYTQKDWNGWETHAEA